MTRVIRKIGGIIASSDGKILVVRKMVPGRNTFIIPGGKPEEGESDEEALRRELREELGVEVATLRHFGNFVEPAEFEDARLEMTVFDVEIVGEPAAQSEIVEAIWVDANYADSGVSLGSTLANHVIPQLVESGRM